MKHSHRVYDVVKRISDIVVSAMLLVLLSPILAAIAILVRYRLGAPVLFAQVRPGRGGKPFTLYKFRTMTTFEATNDTQAVATDAERLTRFGRMLRTTSLDELPELWNVLLGQMSVVGPRPLLVEYLDAYTDEQARRHEVRPGITGWAQVNGRNALSWERRFVLDVWYVDNRSVLLDAKILWLTVAAVVKREGVSAEGHATMEPFVTHEVTAPPEEDS